MCGAVGPVGPQDQLSAGDTAELLSVSCYQSTGPKGLPGARTSLHARQTPKQMSVLAEEG